MKASHFALLTGLCLHRSATQAIVFPIEAHVTPRAPNRIAPRGVTQITSSAGAVQYRTNITLGGTVFSVILDTRSSDFWVTGPVRNSKSFGDELELEHDRFSVKGPVRTADLQIAGYSVSSQAYVEVAENGGNVKAQKVSAGEGAIGLGLNIGSSISQSRQRTAAAANFLERIFLQNASIPRIATISLPQVERSDDELGGTLTIGEVPPAFAEVREAPRLLVTSSTSATAEYSLRFLLDKDGLIGPTGSFIPISAQKPNSMDKGRAVVVIDSSSFFSKVPRDTAKVVYSSFDGAEIRNLEGLGDTWTLPCNHEVNISWVFEGKQYPVHPLITSVHPSLLKLDSFKTSQGEAACIGSFQPFGEAQNPSYHIALGANFLQNVHTLINYGDNEAGSEGRKPSFLQILSTVDPAKAHADFLRVRSDKNATIVKANITSDKGSITTTNDGVTSDGAQNGRTTTSPVLPIALGITIPLVLLFIVGGVFFYRRKIRGSSEPYRSLSHPAPAEDITSVGYPRRLSGESSYSFSKQARPDSGRFSGGSWYSFSKQGQATSSRFSGLSFASVWGKQEEISSKRSSETLVAGRELSVGSQPRIASFQFQPLELDGPWDGGRS